jgi:hypothetical protein
VPRYVLDGDVSVPQVTDGDPEESGRHARPQAYTDDRDSRFEDLDGWTSSRAPDIDSTAEPMEKMNSAVRHRAMAVWLTLSGNLLHPQAPHELTEPRGWAKLMERAPRAVVYDMWIPHQPCSVCRDPIVRCGSSHGGPMHDPPHCRRDCRSRRTTAPRHTPQGWSCHGSRF